jgi:pimeloyl-ACP methyl ester carboxylesterase
MPWARPVTLISIVEGGLMIGRSGAADGRNAALNPQSRAWLFSCALLMASLLFAMSSSVAAAPICKSSSLPVALGPGLPANKHVFVKLCLPEGTTPQLVQLLVHGVTYSHTYWDFPDPTGGTTRYSYVASATSAGYATLSIDRIGIGNSSRPLSALVGLDANVYVVHQVVQALRNGTIEGPGGSHPAFSKVIGVGHSFGSGILWFVATRHQNLDGLVLTGFTHKLNLDALPTLALQVYPAILDPRFGLLSMDVGYLTTTPNSRYGLFYAPAPADPAVVALDEQTKETLTEREVADVGFLLLTPLDIRVPVLLVMGQNDALFCSPPKGGTDCSTAAALLASEGPFLGANVPSLEGYVLPGAGHDVNLMLNAQEFFTAAQNWIQANFGS